MASHAGHGTFEAWQRHQRNGTQPCESCEIAREFIMQLQRRARIARLIRETAGVIAGAYVKGGARA